LLSAGAGVNKCTFVGADRIAIARAGAGVNKCTFVGADLCVRPYAARYSLFNAAVSPIPAKIMPIMAIPMINRRRVIKSSSPVWGT